MLLEPGGVAGLEAHEVGEGPDRVVGLLFAPLALLVGVESRLFVLFLHFEQQVSFQCSLLLLHLRVQVFRFVHLRNGGGETVDARYPESIHQLLHVRWPIDKIGQLLVHMAHVLFTWKPWPGLEITECFERVGASDVHTIEPYEKRTN